MEQEPALTTDTTGLEIAVIGVALRFPAAETPEELWTLLREGGTGLREISEAELRSAGVSAARLAAPGYVRVAAPVGDIESFDAELFGIAPREAALIDPQQRVLLECAWEALERAGYDPERYLGAIGVYAGAGVNQYAFQLATNPAAVELAGSLQVLLGNDKDYLTSRIAYRLGLRGPAVTVQTACSTSLVAVHLACQALLTGECQLALAGGVSLRIPQNAGYSAAEGDIYSPDGACRPYDARGAGTIFGSGAGLVVLKRLDDALADGDVVRAVIKGSAINNDGDRKVGFTAPGLEGQAAVIRAALVTAEVDPASISYVEGHGTATPLGDPIEVGALQRAFGSGLPSASCALGSIKSNLGHLDTAAGVAGLIKAVLCLERRELVPTVHFESPNPQIDFAAGPFEVVRALRPWRGPRPRRAGVSSFGIGGTNAHVVLEEAPPPAPADVPRGAQLLRVSARSPEALRSLAGQLADRLAGASLAELADAAYTLEVGRRRLPMRAAVVVTEGEGAAAALREVSSGARRLVQASQPPPPLAFLLPGQGAQRPGMAAELYAAEPLFQSTIDQCAQLLEPMLGHDLRAWFTKQPPGEAPGEAALMLQPALFVTELALARLWLRRGLRPTALLGHSLGEYVAAHLAGVWSLPDALRLVAGRAQLLASLPAGAMILVAASEDRLRELLADGLDIAADNGPELVSVAGSPERIASLEARLDEMAIEHRRLPVQRAFHSRLVEPILESFERLLTGVEMQAPQIPFVSNLTGTWITTEQARSPGYWLRHLRRPVRFREGLATLLADAGAHPVLLEVGPGRTLSSLAARQVPQDRAWIVSSMPHAEDKVPESEHLLTALGELWSAGYEVDGSAFGAGERRRRLELPTYPFERRRCWVDPAPAGRVPEAQEGRALRLDDLAFFHPTWERLARPSDSNRVEPGRCLLFTREGTVERALGKELRARGWDVIEVHVGPAAAGLGSARAQLPPDDGLAYRALFEALARTERTPDLVVHAWLAEPAAADLRLGLSPWRELGFASLIHLVRALDGASGASRLVLVASELFKVAGDEALCPAKALALGPCRTLSHEYPALASRVVEVPAIVARLTAQPLRALVDEVVAPQGPALVALRGTARWQPAFQPWDGRAIEGRDRSLRDDGFYLVSGGTGGMGLRVAERLLDAGPVRLVLLGARPLAPARDEAPAAGSSPDPLEQERAEYLERFRARGAQVETVATDLTDREAMAELLARLESEHGRLNGVIHAASSSDRGLIANHRGGAMASNLGAKVEGALVLAELLADRDVDFLVFCSSTIALSGGLGQVDYCAANCFLDSLAHELAAVRGDSVTSINWDGWQGVGMSAPAMQRARARRLGDPIGHPLLQRRVVDREDEKGFSALLEAESHWLLREHRLDGQALLPGSALVETFYQVWREAGFPGSPELLDLVFERPLLVLEGEATEMQTTLLRRGGTWTAHIASLPLSNPSQARTRHASCRLQAQSEGVGLSFLPPAGWQEVPLESVEGRKLGQTGLVRWGPRWQCLEAVGAADGTVVARIRLPAAFAHDLDELTVHPALLDLATAVGVLASGKSDYLPLAYERVTVRRAPGAELVSVGRLRDSEDRDLATFDVWLFDSSGSLCVEVEGFTLRRVTSGEEALGSHAPRAPEPAAKRSGLEPTSAVEAMLTILRSSPGPQIVVTAVAASPAAELPAVSEEPAAAPALPTQGARPRVTTPYVAPRNELEEMIVGLWRDLLGFEQIGVHDNFFELGGHSLLAIRLVGLLRDALDLSIPLAQLLQAPTVAKLAELIVRMLTQQSDPGALELALSELEDGADPGSRGEPDHD
jgi:phthiocerol/phenolphthiocerol synthesis type-I polyketide synthase E